MMKSDSVKEDLIINSTEENIKVETISVKRIQDVWDVNANPATSTFWGVSCCTRFSERYL
jgi:hypothetical protein